MEAGDLTAGTTRRDRERARSEERILAAAAELFARQSYQKTSMKDLAERADMSVGRLYSYFPGKEDIYRQLLVMYLTEMHRKMDEAGLPTDPPLEQLRKRVAAAITHFGDHVDFLKIYNNESPIACEGILRRELIHNREEAAKLFAKAMEQGDIGRDDPAILSAVLIGSVHELMHTLAELGDVTAFGDVTAIVDRIIIAPLKARSTR